MKTDFDKPQIVRLWDVFALGPFMVWYGATSKHPPIAKTILVTSGILTILYNGRNYLINAGKQNPPEKLNAQHVRRYFDGGTP